MKANIIKFLYGGLAATLIIGCSSTSSNEEFSEDKMRSAYSYAYNSQGTLSHSDFRLIIRMEHLNYEWNMTTAHLAADMINDSIEPVEWVRRSKPHLARAAVIVQYMIITSSQIDDRTTAAYAERLAKTNVQLLECWSELAWAMSNEDQEACRRAGQKGSALAQEKARAALPIMRRLRDKLGAETTDAAIEAMIRDMIKRLGL